jgi:hypothetical protein
MMRRNTRGVFRIPGYVSLTPISVVETKAGKHDGVGTGAIVHVKIWHRLPQRRVKAIRKVIF